MGSREGIEVVKVEVLEQRILLAADLSVAGSDHLLQTQAAETAPAAPTASQSTQAPSAWSAPVLADPLQLHSPAGSVLDLQAAPAGQALSLPEGHALTGSGAWAGPLINSGVVAPGESPGVLSVQAGTCVSTRIRSDGNAFSMLDLGDASVTLTHIRAQPDKTFRADADWTLTRKGGQWTGPGL